MTCTISNMWHVGSQMYNTSNVERALVSSLVYCIDFFLYLDKMNLISIYRKYNLFPIYKYEMMNIIGYLDIISLDAYLHIVHLFIKGCVSKNHYQIECIFLWACIFIYGNLPNNLFAMHLFAISHEKRKHLCIRNN